MSRLFYHTMQDNAGNLLFDVSGTMRIAGSGTLATIYGDEALTVILPNPMTNHPSYGSFKCFLGPGDYDFYMAKAGYTFETLTGVQGSGTMADQNATAVAITGGTAVLSAAQIATLGAGRTPDPSFAIAVATLPSYFSTNVQMAARASVGAPIAGNAQLALSYVKATDYGIVIKPLDVDLGTGNALVFLNQAGGVVGSINTNATATSFNVSSDARLKHNITTLVGELAVIRALRPVRFRWLSDDSEGVGFIASEVAEHVQGVITGEPDAMEEDGVTIRPQQIDHSKFVPWLVGAVQTLAGQVETLTERVQALEEGLGV